MTSTGSSPTFRSVRLLDESIFSLLIGPPEEVTNIPAQISARGHRSSPFSEMNSSKDRLTSSPRPPLINGNFNSADMKRSDKVLRSQV